MARSKPWLRFPIAVLITLFSITLSGFCLGAEPWTAWSQDAMSSTHLFALVVPEGLAIRSRGEAIATGLYLVVNSQDSPPGERCRGSVPGLLQFPWCCHAPAGELTCRGCRERKEGLSSLLLFFCFGTWWMGWSFTASSCERETKGNGDHKWQDSVWSCALRLCTWSYETSRASGYTAE